MGEEGQRALAGEGRAVPVAEEIRGRIAVCFSLAELRRLADELGVPDLPWDRGLNEASRELVRQFQRRGQLVALVERLRMTRPLVEWPELTTVPPPSLGGPPLQTSFRYPAPPPVPREEQPPEVHPPASSPQDPPAPSAAPAARSPGFPGTVEPEAPSAVRRVDARWLLVAAGATAVALGLAFLAGRASRPEAAPQPAPVASAAVVRRPEGPATLAAEAIERRIAAVAHACEIAEGAPEDVMRRAHERCGPAPPKPVPREPLDPESDEEEGRSPAPPSPRMRPATAATAEPAPDADGDGGCLSACDRQHRDCRASRCGSEPAQGSQYKRYQDCLSTCLQQASTCRLGCL